MEDPDLRIEDWQRMAVRLALLLWQTLPDDAVEFLDLLEAVRETDQELTDAGRADSVFHFYWDPRLSAIAGEQMEAIESLPRRVFHCDVLTGPADYGRPRMSRPE